MRPALTALVLLAALTVARPIHACLWDSDTLASETKGITDVVNAITGRFERNPPAYYEIRLKRSADQIAANTLDLGAYDDAAVACDRLRRTDEAIAWMEKKGATLDDLEGRKTTEPGTYDEMRYRYLANLGTFRVHKWARSGADRARISEVEAGRALIAPGDRAQAHRPLRPRGDPAQDLRGPAQPARDRDARAALAARHRRPRESDRRGGPGPDGPDRPGRCLGERRPVQHAGPGPPESRRAQLGRPAGEAPGGGVDRARPPFAPARRPERPRGFAGPGRGREHGPGRRRNPQGGGGDGRQHLRRSPRGRGRLAVRPDRRS